MTNKLPSKIFIDGGDPGETKQARELLGFLDGQTTNPTLIAKNLISKKNGQKTDNTLSQKQALDEYKRIVQEINKIIPRSSISIQVFANEETTAEEMLAQARLRMGWITNASIKFPCTHEGLKAAEIACREMPINITLAFSQFQAAAVYEATKGAKFPVFISPFVGRLDDRGENGMQLIENILKMYKDGDGHVEVLTASVRNLDHLMYALQLKSDIITVPFKVIKEWVENGMTRPDENYTYDSSKYTPIPYREDIVLGKNWKEYNLHHELTNKGVAAFWSDWIALFG